MRVLLISFEFPPGQGGTGTYAYHMAKALTAMNVQVTALVHTGGAGAERIRTFDDASGLNIVRFRRPRAKLLKVWHRTLKSWQVVRSREFDLVFIPFPNAAILGWLFHRLYGVPYVVVGHGSEFLGANPLRTWALRLAYRHAAAGVVNSRFTLGLLRAFGVDRPDIRVIPLGADDAVYDHRRPAPVEAPGPEGLEGRKVVVSVSSLRKLKGHHVAVEAVDRLRREIPELLYLIVGRGAQEEELRRMIREKGLEHHVRLEGHQEWARLRAYYNCCDVFLLNSSFESFGIVLLEAALMGKPVVATAVGGIPEVVEDGRSGILVPPDDPDRTAAALKTLLCDPDLAAAMGHYAYTRAKENFTWSHTARLTREALEWAAGGAGG